MSSTGVAMAQRTQIISKTQSLAVVKNMLRTSISEICYLRNVFDTGCFQEKQYAGVKINTLHPIEKKSGDEKPVILNKDAWILTKWIEEGVFDALDKHYLRAIVFAIYTANDECKDGKLIEAYNYKVTYPAKEECEVECISSGGGNKSINFTADSIRNQAVVMIRTLITMCSTLEPLPNDRWINMKLFYYDDITPSDYQPKFFVDASECDDMKIEFEDKPLKVDIGKLETPYHNISVRIRTLDSFINDKEKDNNNNNNNKKNEDKKENETKINDDNNNNKQMEIVNINDNEDAETQYDELSQPIMVQQQQQQQQYSINKNNEPLDVDFIHNENMNDKNKKLCCEAIITIHNNNIKNITMLQLSKLLGSNYNAMKGVFDTLINDGFLLSTSSLSSRYGKEVVYSDEISRKLITIKNYLTGESTIKVISETPNKNIQGQNVQNGNTPFKRIAEQKAEEMKKYGVGTPDNITKPGITPVKEYFTSNKNLTRKRIYKPDNLDDKIAPMKRDIPAEDGLLLSQDSQIGPVFGNKTSIIQDPIHQVNRKRIRTKF